MLLKDTRKLSHIPSKNVDKDPTIPHTLKIKHSNIINHILILLEEIQ